MAYDSWCEANDQKYNEAAYEAFEKLYEQQAIAQATAKKLQRDLDGFVNEAPKAPPPRKVTSTPVVERKQEKEMFFANQ